MQNTLYVHYGYYNVIPLFLMEQSVILFLNGASHIKEFKGFFQNMDVFPISQNYYHSKATVSNISMPHLSVVLG
jgi:hypothetical protein